MVQEECVPVAMPRPPIVVDGSSSCWTIAAGELATKNLEASQPGSRVVRPVSKPKYVFHRPIRKCKFKK